MKRIIIFGATGHVGSYLTKYAKDYFQDDEYEIIASGRRKNAPDIEKLGVKYIAADMTKPEDFAKLPRDNVFAVIDLAAVIPAYMDGYHPEEYLNSIIMGTFNVLEYCRTNNVDRILFSTTCYDVWEYPTGTVIKPDMPLNFSYTGDHAVYVIAKNTATEFLKHYHLQYGIKTFVFRFPTIYSYSPNSYIYPNGIKTLRPLYKCIYNAIEGKPIEIWGDPNYAKDMVHVYDVAQMFCKAIEVNNITEGIYNCSTGVPVTLQEQMEAIVKVFCKKGKESEIIVLDDKIAGGGLLMDVENAKKELGYEPIYDVEKLFRNFKEEMELNRFDNLRKMDGKGI